MKKTSSQRKPSVSFSKIVTETLHSSDGNKNEVRPPRDRARTISHVWRRSSCSIIPSEDNNSTTGTVADENIAKIKEGKTNRGFEGDKEPRMWNTGPFEVTSERNDSCTPENYHSHGEKENDMEAVKGAKSVKEWLKDGRLYKVLTLCINPFECKSFVIFLHVITYKTE